MALGRKKIRSIRPSDKCQQRNAAIYTGTFGLIYQPAHKSPDNIVCSWIRRGLLVRYRSASGNTINLTSKHIQTLFESIFNGWVDSLFVRECFAGTYLAMCAYRANSKLKRCIIHVRIVWWNSKEHSRPAQIIQYHAHSALLRRIVDHSALFHRTRSQFRIIHLQHTVEFDRTPNILYYVSTHVVHRTHTHVAHNWGDLFSAFVYAR